MHSQGYISSVKDIQAVQGVIVRRGRGFVPSEPSVDEGSRTEACSWRVPRPNRALLWYWLICLLMTRKDHIQTQFTQLMMPSSF